MQARDLGIELVEGPKLDSRRTRDLGQLVDDLRTTGVDAVAALRDLPADAGDHPSACAGWSITECVSHLAADAMVVRVIGGQGIDRQADPEQMISDMTKADAPETLGEAIDALETARSELVEALSELTPEQGFERVPWFGTPITVLALGQSRVMETWIHLWDCLRPLGVAHTLDNRAWWVGDLGLRTLPYAIGKADLTPDVHLELELDGPGGGSWDRTIGAGSHHVRVTGPAWAWIAACTHRSGSGDALFELDVEGDERGAAQIRTVRAFM